MIRYGYMVVLVAAYLAFLVPGVPAARVLHMLAGSQAPVTYFEIRGNVMQGSVRGLTVHGLGVGDFGWRLAPAALLEGCAEFTVNGGRAGTFQVSGAVGTCVDGMRYARGVHGSASVQAVAGGLAAQGEVNLQMELLRGDAAGVHEVRGALSWRDAVVDVRTPIRLGTVTLGLRAAGGGVTGDLLSTGGDADLRGTVHLDAGTLALDAALAARHARASAALSDLLPRDAAGRFPLRWRAAVPGPAWSG